jgi:hypothetical protein
MTARDHPAAEDLRAVRDPVEADRQDLAVAPWDRSTPWAATGRVAGPALLERGLELIEETLGPVDIPLLDGDVERILL